MWHKPLAVNLAIITYSPGHKVPILFNRKNMIIVISTPVKISLETIESLWFKEKNCDLRKQQISD